jgi:hypothetical protein
MVVPTKLANNTCRGLFTRLVLLDCVAATAGIGEAGSNMA